MAQKIKQKLPIGRPVQAIKKHLSRTVRYNENEHNLMLKNAKLSGMKPAEWIRESSVKKVVHPRFNKDDRKVLHMLAGVANNLNQLTALSHQMGIESTYKKCLLLIDEINGYLNYLHHDRKD